MDHPEQSPETELNAEEFARSVANDPVGALRRFQELQTQARLNASTPLSSAPSASPVPTPASPPIDPQLIATLVAQTVSQVLAAQPTPTTPAPAVANSSSTRLSEKLPDIAEYEGDQDKLDAWEQSLKQRMYLNHDRYPSD